MNRPRRVIDELWPAVLFSLLLWAIIFGSAALILWHAGLWPLRGL